MVSTLYCRDIVERDSQNTCTSTVSNKEIEERESDETRGEGFGRSEHGTCTMIEADEGTVLYSTFYVLVGVGRPALQYTV